MTGAEVDVFHKRMCKAVLRLVKAPSGHDASFIWECEHGHQFTMQFIRYHGNRLQSVLVEPEPIHVADPDSI